MCNVLLSRGLGQRLAAGTIRLVASSLIGKQIVQGEKLFYVLSPCPSVEDIKILVNYHRLIHINVQLVVVYILFDIVIPPCL